MAQPTRYDQELVTKYTKMGFWDQLTVSHYWDRNAREFPEREAFVDPYKRLTWKQSVQQVNRLALSLLELGIKKDEVIFCQLPNWFEALLCRAACEKAGILALAAPMTMRHSEVENIIKRVNAVAAVVTGDFYGFDYYQMLVELQPSLPSLKHIIIAGEKVPEGTIALKEMVSRPVEEKYPEDCLEKTRLSGYEICGINVTTGTTGFPKLIEVPENPWKLSGQIAVQKFWITPQDNMGEIIPIVGGPGFIFGWYAAALAGAKVVMLERFDPTAALELIEKERITIVVAVPTQMTLMVRHPDLHKYDVSSVRAFCWAGSVLPYDVAKECEEKFQARITGCYGALDMSCITISSVDDPSEVRWTSVGKAFLGTEIKLVDDEGKEVPQGEVGEVTIRGPHCGSGYYLDPEMTRQTWDADGWGKLGDLGRFDADYNLTIVGRKKDIIIRGGQNIYPGEIESILVTHPKITNVAIVPIPDPVMGEKACACVILKPEEKFTFEEMITFLEERKMARYKLPEYLEVVDSFPLLADQKVDKRKLSSSISARLKS